MKIAENIYFYYGDQDYVANKKFYLGYGASNFLIITGEKQFTIDPCILNGPFKKRIQQNLDSDSINLFNTDTIILTHFHPDHIIGAKKIIKNKSSQLWCHTDCEDFLYNRNYQIYSYLNFPTLILKEIFGWYYGLFKYILLMTGYYFKYLRADFLFEDYSNFYFNDIETEIISTTGHCPGHISIYFPKEKIMFCGDLFSEMPHLFPLLSNGLSSYESSLDDIDMLLTKDINILIPGHGKYIKGKSTITKYLNKLKSNIYNVTDNILEIIGTKPASITYLQRQIFPVHGFEFSHYRSCIYHVLRYLRKKHRVAFFVNKKKVFWHTI